MICGERRWRAAQRANLGEVWLVERAATDAEAYRMALSENLHRVGLSRVERLRPWTSSPSWPILSGSPDCPGARHVARLAGRAGADTAGPGAVSGA
ncbi:MAG: ParB N-terminal domain-containing protein [Chloroflexi bacterium]|nr:ParB N-terminal domain-containing protein [Chloroflexota bacterium]